MTIRSVAIGFLLTVVPLLPPAENPLLPGFAKVRPGIPLVDVIAHKALPL
jgi:hypothetical protein